MSPASRNTEEIEFVRRIMVGLARWKYSGTVSKVVRVSRERKGEWIWIFIRIGEVRMMILVGRSIFARVAVALVDHDGPVSYCRAATGSE